MNKKIITIVIMVISLAMVSIASAALLTPNRPGGLLAPLSLSNLILDVASPFTINGASSTVIYGDGTQSIFGGGISINGAMNIRVDSVSTSTVLSGSNGIIIATATSTMTLPSAIGIKGRLYIIKTVNSSTVEIASNGTSTIDGTTTTTITISYESKRLFSDGENWLTF